MSIGEHIFYAYECCCSIMEVLHNLKDALQWLNQSFIHLGTSAGGLKQAGYDLRRISWHASTVIVQAGSRCLANALELLESCATHTALGSPVCCLDARHMSQPVASLNQPWATPDNIQSHALSALPASCHGHPRKPCPAAVDHLLQAW